MNIVLKTKKIRKNTEITIFVTLPTATERSKLLEILVTCTQLYVTYKMSEIAQQIPNFDPCETLKNANFAPKTHKIAVLRWKPPQNEKRCLVAIFSCCPATNQRIDQIFGKNFLILCFGPP